MNNLYDILAINQTKILPYIYKENYVVTISKIYVPR